MVTNYPQQLTATAELAHDTTEGLARGRSGGSASSCAGFVATTRFCTSKATA